MAPRPGGPLEARALAGYLRAGGRPRSVGIRSLQEEDPHQPPVQSKESTQTASQVTYHQRRKF